MAQKTSRGFAVIDWIETHCVFTQGECELLSNVVDEAGSGGDVLLDQGTVFGLGPPLL